ncbi:MAG: hypothetical protein WD119_02470 [Pirellulaceae bacterium]
MPSVLLVGMLVWLYYRRELHGTVGWAAWLLPTLRSLAVIMVLLTFLSPVIYRRWVEGRLGRVVFVIDDSHSMRLSDEGEKSRIETVRTLLFDGDDAVVNQLAETHALRVVTGSSESLETVWSHTDPAERPNPEGKRPTRLSSDGTSTDLAALLRQTKSFFGDLETTTESDPSANPHSAVVLLSDGRHNEKGTPATAARQLGAVNVPVHTVQLGKAEEPIDVAVVEATVPDRIFFRNRLRGSLLVKENLTVDQPYRIQISAGQEVLWEETFTASSPGVREIPFDINIEEATRRQTENTRSPQNEPSADRSRHAAVGIKLRVNIQTDADEVDRSNNQHAFGIWSITKEARLLIVDGRSRWETRYVRNLFDRDPQWKVDVTIAGPASELKLIRAAPGDGGFPTLLSELSRYDAIVLGEIPPDVLSEKQFDTLQEYVDHGGGLVVVDGTRGHLHRQLEGPLGRLIPVLSTQSESVSADGFQLDATGANRNIVQIDEDAGQSDTIWRELIPPRSMVATSALPGADILISANTENGSLPWLVTRRYGGGRVVYLAGDETWRWRIDVADLYHGRFWNQLMRSVMPPLYPVSDQYADLDTGPRSRQAGEQAEIRVRLHDLDGSPRGDALVDAVLLRDQQPFATINLTATDPVLGTYGGLTPPLPPGDYQVRVQASGFAREAISVQSRILVDPTISRESIFQASDPALLQAIADASGGTKLAASEAGSLVDLLEPLSTGRVVESEIALWQSFPWFVVIIVLLTLEWLVRKGVGLV